jgi:hypothetical protein
MKFSTACVFGLAFQALACGGTSDEGAQAQGATNACNLSTPYKGDELCILPPAPGEGIQLHVGPSDYTNNAEVAQYVIAPSSEDVRCFNAPIPESDFYYLKQENRMRSGSHHMLIPISSDASLTAGPDPNGTCLRPSATGSIPGSQTPSRSFPDKLGAEDQGLARHLPPSTMALFQMHYINTGDQPELREAWVNLYKTPASEVTQQLQDIFFVGDFGIDIKAGSTATTTVQATPTLPDKIRLYEVHAHMHAHAQHFTLLREHAGTEDDMYESFDWEDPRENTFNTAIQNPLPDAATHADGGLSGLQYLSPGDTLKWSCLVNNDTNADLRFRNEALTGEMCMLVGSYISPTANLLAGLCTNGSCSQGLGLLGVQGAAPQK